MPTYEYHCEVCDKTFDYFQSMNDARLETCIMDGCDGKVKRLLGKGAGIIFKGSGFYETDYRSDSYNKAKSADSGNSEGGASKSDSKSDSSKSSSSSSDSKSSSSSPDTSTKAASSSTTSSSTSKPKVSE